MTDEPAKTADIDKGLEAFFKAGKVRDEVLKWLVLPSAGLSWLVLHNLGSYALGFVFLVPTLLVMWHWFHLKDIISGMTFLTVSLGGLFVVCWIGACIIGVSLAYPEQGRLLSNANLVGLVVGDTLALIVGTVLLLVHLGRNLLGALSRSLLLDISVNDRPQQVYRTEPHWPHFWWVILRNRDWRSAVTMRILAPWAFDEAAKADTELQSAWFQQPTKDAEGTKYGER
jgi:hypothetical protein